MMIKAGQILSFDKELENTRNQSLQELVKRQDIREFVEKNHLTKKGSRRCLGGLTCLRG